MMKKLLLATTASGLMLSTAFAQSPAPGANSSAVTPPAAAKQLDSASPAATEQNTMMMPAPDDALDQQVLPSKAPDQMLASEFNGTEVVGADNKEIGDVSDVLFNNNGKVLAYVVSIGGFLDIGSKDIALAPSAFKFVKGKESGITKLKISMSHDQLKQMRSFRSDQRWHPTTTGMAPSSTSTARPGHMG